MENRNVYKGHRYVPKIMGGWDQQETYEGLSIVTNQGTSFTSKKRVPVGIDILDEEYWVVTGNYNAQVENYRQEVKDYKEQVDIYKQEITDQVEDFSENFSMLLDQTIHLITPDMTTEEIQSLLDLSGTFKFIKGIYDLDFLHSIGTDNVCLDVKSNSTLFFEKGAILKLPVNSYGRYNMIRVSNKENVQIYGGEFIGDRTVSTGRTGEWGHGISIQGSKNVKVKYSLVRNCWGDGFGVGHYMVRDQDIFNNSENVTIENCIGINNRRQGLSVTASIHGKYLNNIFSNTNGTLPESGIDLEPDREFKVEYNLVSGNVLHDNNGQGLLMDTRFAGYELTNHNIITNNVSYNNNEHGMNILNSKYTTIEKNTCFNNKKSGIRLGVANESIVSNNIVMGNESIGLSIQSSVENLVSGNISKNNNIGISLNNSNENTITNNRVYENNGSGIHIITSSNNFISLNTITKNDSVAENGANMTVLNLSTRNAIQGNNFIANDDNLINQPDYALRIEGASNSNNIYNNNFRNGATIKAIENSATGNIVGHNIDIDGLYTTEFV